MPRENRKRGKRHKKQEVEDEYPHQPNTYEDERQEPGQQAGPSWIVQGHSKESEVNPDAPFGYVDPDVKAYFRTVDDKLREWQEVRELGQADEGEGDDPNDERRLFLVAALAELSGKEMQLATDPDCSNVLERMAYSMDDFIKRVFMDRLAGSYELLCRHRFGSHVVQTLLMVAKSTIGREMRGIFPDSTDSKPEEGQLQTLTQLIVNFGEELLPSATTLIMDPFASHVFRALIILLCPSLSVASDSAALRSKKSAKYRAKQGPMKSVFADHVELNENDKNAKGKTPASGVLCPPEFDDLARKFVQTIRENLSDNEVRALAADKVACPVLVLLLEMESVLGSSNEAGSLMDCVSAGLISACTTPHPQLESSDFVTTLLREATASHLLEKLVSLSPPAAFNALWELYFHGKLNKLAVHPVANFVVSRAVERLDKDQLSTCLQELEGSWLKIIKNARTGVLKMMIDRSAKLSSMGKEVCEAIYNAFGLDNPEKRQSLIQCVLYLKTYDDFEKVPREAELKDGDDEQASNRKGKLAELEPTIQGSLLIQSMLTLNDSENATIIDSVISLQIPTLLLLCHNSVSSRIFDAFLSSPTVPARAKRKLIMIFIGHYHQLVDDRIGSRVGERLWESADPYLKEKIARSLIPHEQELVGSFFGKFFARGLNLYLLKRNPEEWKSSLVKVDNTQPSKGTTQLTEKKAEKVTDRHAIKQVVGESGNSTVELQKKRKRVVDKPEGEIDALFSILGKKQKKGSLATSIIDHEPKEVKLSSDKPKTKTLSNDKDLDHILGAIKNAPKDMASGRKHKKR